jgi:hypothetical protein
MSVSKPAGLVVGTAEEASRWYTMDNVARIGEMKDRGFAEAREQSPELRRHFLDRKAERFIPFHSV